MDLSVDFHTHLIPDVDDGARGSVETVAMARGLVELGVRRIHLTPHQFRLGNEFTPSDLERMTDGVRQLLGYAGVDVEVVAGAEYYYGDRLFRALQTEEELITFEQGARKLILIELPLDRPAAGVRRVARTLKQRHITPVMAHPERCAEQAIGLDRILAWRRAGWLFQLNLLSLVGVHGKKSQSVAQKLVREHQYRFVGSDLHRPFTLDTLRHAHRVYRDIVRTETPA